MQAHALIHTYYAISTCSPHAYTQAHITAYLLFPTYRHACIAHGCVVLLLPLTLTETPGDLLKFPNPSLMAYW